MNAARPFATFLGPMTFLGLKTNFALGSSGGLHLRFFRAFAWLIDGGGLLALELGARFRLLEQLCVLAHLAACTEHVAPSWLELQSTLGTYA